MEKSKFLALITICWLFAGTLSFAQSHRFMVFFNDKNSDYEVENPQEFLSQRAIDRRIKQAISITEEDLPVSGEYVNALESLGATVWYTTKWLNGALIQTDSSSLEDISELMFVDSVEMVAPGPLITQNQKQNRKDQILLNARTQSTEIQNRLLGVDVMQQEGFTGEGMLIAVFDGGFEGVDQIPAFSHLTENNQLTIVHDYVGNSDNVFRYDDHGTKVFSVIGANQPGVFTGSAYDADFILCVTEDVSSEYRVEEYNWLFAAEMADSTGVDIINTSLGYSDFDDGAMNYQLTDLDGVTTAISKAASIAASKGIVLTISAGNEGNSSWKTITAPADILEALSVGAIKDDSLKASFSSTGPTADGRTKPDVVALGVNTAVINKNGNIVFNNGTSFSAPQIAGLAAGIWQYHPEFTSQEIIQAVRKSGHQYENANSDTGFGIPNFEAARDLVLTTADVSEAQMIRLYPNPVGDRFYLIASVSLPQATIFIHNLSGQTLMEHRINNIPAQVEIAIDAPNLIPGVYLVTVLAAEDAESFKLIRE